MSLNARALRCCSWLALACVLVTARAGAQGDDEAEQGTAAPRVLAIDFEGVPEQEVPSLKPYVEFQPGDPLVGREIRDAVRALHASTRFSQVRAFVEPMSQTGAAGTRTGVRVIFVVTPIRRLLTFNTKGNTLLGETTLRRSAELQANTEYRPELIQPAIEGIKAAYRRIGYRNADAKEEITETPEGVKLVLRVTEGPPTIVSKLHFVGQLALDPQDVARSFPLREGDVFDQTALDEGVRALRDRYRRASHLQARVNEPRIAKEEGTHVELEIEITAGPEVHLLMRGNRSYPDSLLIGKLDATSSEEALDDQRAQELGEQLRRFYVQQGFLGAKVRVRTVPSLTHALDLVFSIDEGLPLEVTRIDFKYTEAPPQGDARAAPAEGAPEATAREPAFPADELRKRLLLILRDNISIDPGFGADFGQSARLGMYGRMLEPPSTRTRTDPDTVYDARLYARALRQIEDLYKSQGYLWVKVGPVRLTRLVPGPGHDLERAQEVPFDPEAPAALARPPREGPADVLDPWTPGEPVLARVEIPIIEGDRAIVSKVDNGVSAKSDAHLQEMKLKPGQPFTFQSAEEDRVNLTAAFTSAGYFYCKVEDDESFLEKKPDDPPNVRLVEVRYRILEGPVVHAAYVKVDSNTHTDEDFIRALVEVKEGAVITPQLLDKGQQNLLNTGLFYSATLQPLNPEVAEPEKTIVIVLRERPRFDFQSSTGFSLADGPRATAQVSLGNLGGRNLTLSLLGKVNFPIFRYVVNTCLSTRPDGTPLLAGESICSNSFDIPDDPVERVVDLGLHVPRMWPFTNDVSTNVDLIHVREVRDSYKLTKYSGQLSTAVSSLQWAGVGLGLAYEVGYQIVSKGQRTVDDVLNGVDQSVFRLPEGSFFFGSLRPQLTFDKRFEGDPVSLRLLLQFNGDYLRSLTDSSIHVNLFKLWGLAAATLSLRKDLSLVFWGRAGRVFQLDALSETPGDRRFYLGGATSLRGFHEDAVQPQDVRDELRQTVTSCQALLTGLGCADRARVLQAGITSEGGNQFLSMGVELRVPIASALELALFYDAGNLWVTPISLFDVSSLVLRDAVGVGLRYATPVGRLAIDLGMNLNPDTDLGEPRLAFYFSIQSF
ncbi:MAG: BamA/TamA family outer membrane protein [Deltaproteobacteria bacterium]|nr:BamA/TamA family outer membrane protein [Deltaproteobacteria bacterium]